MYRQSYNARTTWVFLGCSPVYWGLNVPGRISTQYLCRNESPLRESMQHLNQISDAPVGVEDERDVLHLPVAGLLLKADTECLKAVARRLDVVDGDGDVAEAAAGVRVARGVAGESRVRLGAVVVGELEDALALEAVLGRRLLAVVVGKEVKREGLELILWKGVEVG